MLTFLTAIMQAFKNDVDTTTHESGEKQHYLQRKKKRDLALESWKWNEVIDLVSVDNQHQLTNEVDTIDTTELVKPFKIPRLTIQSRNRFFKLRHLPDDEDYGYVMILSFVFKQLFHNFIKVT